MIQNDNDGVDTIAAARWIASRKMSVLIQTKRNFALQICPLLTGRKK
jgi:hypothetical protein